MTKAGLATGLYYFSAADAASLVDSVHMQHNSLFQELLSTNFPFDSAHMEMVQYTKHDEMHPETERECCAH